MIPKVHQEAFLYKIVKWTVHEYEVLKDRYLDKQIDITSQAGNFSVFIMTV